ncbi:MAG: hypothetical protein Q8Q88_23570 [Phenylobacterium sp.]|uniref:hypothetical protein n=1 Tax=Phenylobacterium sp. TaxID=1871053 RepID=UPI0027355BE8|nr:hypothetical protein [Phenylobacterium sp.]MDP3750017.1 hypothetical protein [Phenylobacterium sp.]
MQRAPRIQPPAPEAYTERMQQAATLTKRGRDGQMQKHYAAMMANPYFLERWLRMSGTVVGKNRLSDREKMMVVMHLAWCMRCSYAWVQRQGEKDPATYIPSLHTKPQDHLTRDELHKLTMPAKKALWPKQDSALLLAVEQTFEAGGISSKTWSDLSEFLDEGKLYDLVMLLGFYLMTMSMLNSLGVANYEGDPVAPWPRIDNGAPA